MDTEYALSWATVARFFDDNPAPETTPRVVVWLSDGGSDDWPQAKPELQKLLDKGVQVESLIFKSGETKQVSEVGIRPSLVDGSPGSLMKAFADAFRRIAGAPYRVDGSVSANPKFAIKPHMEDVWVVVYGDESLLSASVSGGGKTEQASYASDHHNGAAYRVALLKNPPAGEWTVSVSGGGPDTSYAVIQRSTITPHPVAPKEVFTGVPFKLDTTLRTASGEDLVPADLPEPAELEAIVDGQTIPLHDDGSNGHFITMLTASRSGPMVITVHAHNSFFDQRVKVTVDARGYFRYHGGPVTIDFGSFKAGHTVCRPLTFVAEQEGAVPFELRKVAQWPAHLDFVLKGVGKHTSPGGSPIPLLPQDAKEICLAAGSDADNSESRAQSWVSLSVSGRQDAESMIDLRLSWSVHRLTFWEKWSWLILMILGALLVFFIIYGYIKPFRFPPGLALCFAPAIDELDDQTPQPVRLWRGVGIGFYRNARACLHDTFRINGKVKGSVAILQAGPRRSVIVKPQSRALYRDIGVNEWDQVAHTGRRASQGEIYRVGDSGPYFRISVRMNV